MNISTKNIINKVLNNERITSNEAVNLYNNLNLIEIGRLASIVRQKKLPNNIVSYIVDRNINYTNICVVDCKFCSFYKRLSSKEGYVLKDEEIYKKIKETKDLGGTGILIQGGLNPRLKLDYYTNLLKNIKSRFDIHIHGFSPPEIHFIAQKIEKKPLSYIINELKKAGLDSIPGGGAEILVDRVRDEISKKKCTSEEWLSVMRESHKLNIKTTATMMLDHVETLEDRIEHLFKIRELQDFKNGFTAFIPWTYSSKVKDQMNIIEGIPLSNNYLKTLALSRIFLDNFTNIQGSWLSQGPKIGQLSLFFGANDLGSIMIEENVLSSAGFNFKLNEKELIKTIQDSGFISKKRKTLYN